MHFNLKKLLILAVITLIVSQVSFAQNTFIQTYGGDGNDVGSYVIEADAGYVIAGYTTNGSGNQDAYLLRLNDTGDKIWEKSYGGNNTDLFSCVVAASDGYVALGETESFGVGGKDLLLIKVNLSGDVLWSRTVGTPGANILGYSLTTVPGGFLISAGQTPIGASAYQNLFIRISDNGNLVWSKIYDSGTSNILRSCYVEGDLIYTCGGAEAIGCLLRLSLSDGSLLGLSTYDDSGPEALHYLQPTQDGNLMLADHTWAATGGTQMRQWVQKVTKTGATIWSKVYSFPNANLRGRIEPIAEGGFLLTPYDNFAPPTSDAILAKINDEGEIVWAYNYGGNQVDRLFKAQQTSDGGFIAVGHSRSNNQSGNNDDVIVVKTDSNGNIDGCCVKPVPLQADTYVTSSPGLNFSGNSFTGPVNLNIAAATLSLSKKPFCLPELTLPPVQDSFVIDAGGQVQLQAPTGFPSYTWAPAAGLSCTDCTDPIASPDTSTIYILTVADSTGCSATVTYRVLLCNLDKLIIPNAFTPNDDGVNDVFRVVPSENFAEVHSLTIFNRWGQKVWEGSGIDAQWDGKIDGKLAASDVYVWLLKGSCSGEVLQKKGDVSLLR